MIKEEDKIEYIKLIKLQRIKRVIAEVLAEVLKKNKSGYIHTQDIKDLAKEYELNIDEYENKFTIKG